MKTIFSMATFVVLFSLIAGCGKGQSVEEGKIKGLYKQLDQAVAGESIPAVKKVASKGGLKMIDKLSKAPQMAQKQGWAMVKKGWPKGGKVVAFEFSEDGKRCKCQLEGKVGDKVKKGTLEVVKEGDQWKVDIVAWKQ